eukprot:9473024-Pyramimonas_sp.AAC.1
MRRAVPGPRPREKRLSRPGGPNCTTILCAQGASSHRALPLMELSALRPWVHEWVRSPGPAG